MWTWELETTKKQAVAAMAKSSFCGELITFMNVSGLPPGWETGLSNRRWPQLQHAALECSLQLCWHPECNAVAALYRCENPILYGALWSCLVFWHHTLKHTRFEQSSCPTTSSLLHTMYMHAMQRLWPYVRMFCSSPHSRKEEPAVT